MKLNLQKFDEIHTHTTFVVIELCSWCEWKKTFVLQSHRLMFVYTIYKIKNFTRICFLFYEILRVLSELVLLFTTSSITFYSSLTTIHPAVGVILITLSGLYHQPNLIRRQRMRIWMFLFTRSPIENIRPSLKGKWSESIWNFNRT